MGRCTNDGAGCLCGLCARDGDIARRFFDERWIDAPVRPGKSPGAFAHPTVPSAHPYVMLNYQGKTRDVMTLAHELGHGVHQVLAAAAGRADGVDAVDAG
jgi:oligoendopeptidase F